MPHARGATAGMLFTLVIKDTVREGGIPPSQEFSTTDDPKHNVIDPAELQLLREDRVSAL